MANIFSCFPSHDHTFFVDVIIIIAFFHLCCSVSSTQIRCLEEDRSLLLRLKQEISINVDYYYLLDESPPPPPKVWSWNGTVNHEDCCLWEGVTCDSYPGHVIGLDLSSSFIDGGINGSSSIFHLRHLRLLSLADNDMFFTSLFPSGFGNLSSLTHLNLSRAEFWGPIPEHDISRLEKLVSLDLTSIYGHSSVDMEKLVKNLTQLKVLRLDGVDLSRTINNKPWSSLPADLQELSLRNCNFTGEALQLSSLLHLKSSLTHLTLSDNDLDWNLSRYSFIQFPHLISLQLISCKLHGIFPNNIFSIPNLQHLDVSFNLELTGTLPHFPAINNNSLQYINVEETLFSGEIPDSLGSLVMLQELHFSYCQFHGRFPIRIFLNPNLRLVEVRNNSLITGTLPEFPIGNNSLRVINLQNTKFSGKLPDSIHNLASLEELYLDYCMFHGVIPSSINTLTELRSLRLSGNNFSGPLPLLVSSNHIRNLDFSSNKFNGTIPLSYDKFQDLVYLYLSNNNLGGQIPPSLFSLPNLSKLALSSNQLEGQLEEFHNFSSQLAEIDLSHNKLQGHLPMSIFNISNLEYFSVASNDFSGRINLLDITNIENLLLLDLSDNHFQVSVTGELTLSGYPRVLKLSSCNIDSFPDFSENSYSITYLDLSNNKIKGDIPPSICYMKDLEILDLSTNHINGLIPTCLTAFPSLHILSLRNNQLSGMLPGGFAPNCTLRTLDVNQNHLSDELSESLGLCKDLEVIDVGKNYLTGKFPLWLENLPLLRILVLHSNQFGGTVESKNSSGFPLLQIFDVSSNKFVGKMPSGWFRSWEEMMKQSTPPGSQGEVISFTHYLSSTIGDYHFQDSITVTAKGIEREYGKILTSFVLIDVSNNRFTGEIPEAIACLESIHLLNLSNNHFTGHIPVSFGQLSQLESLDLSSNNLSGNIPPQLTKLTFMAKLNLSHNLLTGEIPRGFQFEIFEPDSYEGNPGLCGKPLPKSCYNVKSPPLSNKPDDEDEGGHGFVDWEYYRLGIECGVGTGLVLGFVVAYLVFGNFLVHRRRIRRYVIRPLRT
ncbi:Receptor-like protein 6 [Linum perenne]